MKGYAMFFLTLSLLCCASAVAPTDLTGTRQGKLATSPNVSQNIVAFRFERNAADMIVVLHDILNQNIKGMLVLKASMTDANLSMKMPDGAELSLKLNGNKLDGNLKLNTTNLPVSLTKEGAR